MKFSWEVFKIKMTSRKFWISIAALATAIMTLNNCGDNTILQVTSIITAAGVAVGYAIGNGLTDDTAQKVAEATVKTLE